MRGNLLSEPDLIRDDGDRSGSRQGDVAYNEATGSGAGKRALGPCFRPFYPGQDRHAAWGFAFRPLPATAEVVLRRVALLYGGYRPKSARNFSAR